MEGKASSLCVPAEGSHKGENGKVLIVAGGRRYHGAAVFCILGARRFADMVYFMPGENDEKLMFAVSQVPEAIVINHGRRPVAGIGSARGAESVTELPEADCALAGPGIGDARLDVSGLKRKYAKVILDGDAFKQVEKKELGGLLITPHEGEFRVLFGMDGSPEHVRAMAEKWGCTILKKGQVDVISDGKEMVLVRGGNAGMTKGGTGDVLAGLLCALYAKNGAMGAAVAASRANKKAGELLFKEKGYAYCASDLAEKLPEAMKWR